MTDEPEIERCVCGREAYTQWIGGPLNWIAGCNTWRCWSGPRKAKEADAITAWNTLMRAAKERARLQAVVTEAHETYMAYCHCPDCTEHRAREIERTAADHMTTTEESVE